MDLERYRELGSEEYALSQEEVENEKHIRYDKLWEEQIVRIQHLFDANDEAARQGLLTIFQDEEFVSLCRFNQLYVTAFLLMEIYQEELNHQEPRTILDCGAGYAELDDLITDLKYLLLRIEFTGTENDELFLDYILNRGISKYAVAKLVQYMSLDTYAVYRKLASLFLNREKIAYTLVMLTACDEQKPGLEENLILMAQIYMMVGKKEIAKQCLDKINNPSKEVDIVYAQLTS